MTVFSSLSSFVRRHKKKLIFTAAVSVSVYYLVNQLIIKKFRDFQKSLKQELFVKEQIKRRFVQTQNDCYLTVLALLPVLSQPIVNELPTELITQALKLKKTGSSATQAPQEISDSLLTTDNLIMHQNSNDSKDLTNYMNLTKTELWKLLKIKTLTRALTLMYSISTLLLLTRLQLNTVARRSYLQSVILLAGGQVDNSENSQDYYTEQAYLSLSWWLLNRGWQDMSRCIESAITAKFESINARTEITINKFDQILTEIIDDIAVAHGQDILNAAFPTSYDSLVESLLNTNPDLIKELDIEDSLLLQLTNETSHLIHSDVFGNILNTMVSSAKDTLIDNLTLSLDPNSMVLNTQEKIQELPPTSFQPKSFKLAHILAQISVQSSVLCDNNNFGEESFENELSGNIYISNINELEDLEEFSASIYSNFD